MNDAEFLAALRDLVGANHVHSDPADLEPVLADWWDIAHGGAVAAVYPGSTAEVAAVMRLCAQLGRTVVPQGGNTGLCRGATPQPGGRGIVLGLRRMTALREIDTPSNIVVAEAGLPLAALHDALAEHGRRLPLHLGSEGSAQLGGLISTNAGGTGALRYGPMRDMVAGIEVVLPDGRVLTDLDALRKNNTGYDLKHLFIGAEGTLGIVTAAAFRIHPALRSSAHAWLAVDALDDAVRLLVSLQERFDTAIQAVELLSADQVDLVLRYIPRSRLPLDTMPKWSLMIELGASDPTAPLQAALEDWLASAFEEGLIADAFLAQNQTQAADIWHVRHGVSDANKQHGRSLSHDVAVRPARLPQMIARCSDAVTAAYPQARILIVSHIGDGNVHFIAHFAHDDWAAVPDQSATVKHVMGMVHDIVTNLGGTFSAEHGIGRKLAGELAQRADPARLTIMRGIKDHLDPQRLMNPGAIFPA
ncbi:FAD-binding oxidoreductase [Paracoccus laeviglucosivorans]|uniref:FAD/FMN-containing dehydrogenase n=1 Tax=Paracoccus laeviglucosivorans TaxID=1197861 RepID=A0A521BJ00_9RHOB|nr:FAD-binding oxidoreductase [Paracoccus laeviglucosivorans]SMO47075.1 FAD/FMN-containing dehydrogenase [Paracoccus laeviglucosivorans]